MAQVGEGISNTIDISKSDSKYITISIKEVIFDSGIDIWEIEPGSTDMIFINGAMRESALYDKKIPVHPEPHWGGSEVYPAVYVRNGGIGETKNLKVKVKWSQKGFDGSATLNGKSRYGNIIIKGDFNISGEKGEASVDCEFAEKPDVVKNYGNGIGFSWEGKVKGKNTIVNGANSLKLYFIDQKPKPISGSTFNSYKTHYLQIIDWGTKWAEDKQGEKDVFNAIWDKFSNGNKAIVPHITGFSYWATYSPAQSFYFLLDSDKKAIDNGWSCRAIAHVFMECIAIHGIKCIEVIPYTPPSAKMFLVKNWEHNPTPIPNWYDQPDMYYGGTWTDDPLPPLRKLLPTSSNKKLPKKSVPMIGPLLPGQTRPNILVDQPDELLEIDFHKRPGVPAQGQDKAPLCFRNHWIVEYNGKFYDTSYGLELADNDIKKYAKAALAGWLFDRNLGVWKCQVLSKHSLEYGQVSKN